MGTHTPQHGDPRATAASDVELLDQWSRGDRTSGNQLFERHLPAVYRFFRNKVAGDIDDLVQRTFLGCLEARARFQQKASFKTFLLAIARNQLYLYYRDRKRDSQLDFAISSVYDLGTSPTGALAERQQGRLLLEALQRLPLETQMLVELAYWEELEVAELADVLEVPANTIYSRLRRAREQLRDNLLTISAHAPVELRVSNEALARWALDLKDTAAG